MSLSKNILSSKLVVHLLTLSNHTVKMYKSVKYLEILEISIFLQLLSTGTASLGSLDGISIPSVGGGVPAIPLPINPLQVTASTFELLTDKIGYKMSLTYACGVVMAMKVFLNTSLPIPTPVPLPVPVDSAVGTVGGVIPGGTRGNVIVEEAKYLNPIVLVGSTCLSSAAGLPTPPINCANYNVFQNSMSFD